MTFQVNPTLVVHWTTIWAFYVSMNAQWRALCVSQIVFPKAPSLLISYYATSFSLSFFSNTLSTSHPPPQLSPQSPPKGATIPYRPKPASTPVIFSGGQVRADPLGASTANLSLLLQHQPLPVSVAPGFTHSSPPSLTPSYPSSMKPSLLFSHPSSRATRTRTEMNDTNGVKQSHASTLVIMTIPKFFLR